jgi:outer membrane receptor protein involved in Fe transport
MMNTLRPGSNSGDKQLSHDTRGLRRFVPIGKTNNHGKSWIGAAACIAVVLLLWLGIAPRSLAQVSSGDVLGTVTDTTGAVINNAKITLKNLGTAATRTTTSNDKGEFTFNSVEIGKFTLKVEADGFKSFSIPTFALSTGDRVRYNASLTAGDVTETVEVTSSAAALQTDSSEVSSTVAEKSVADLPLNGRSLEQAIQVQPGLTTATNGNKPEDRRPSFDIAPASGGTVNEMIDGFDNNERGMGYDGVRPSTDSVQEIKVDTSSYSAEFGRASGATVNIITKSGTNEFHGSLYEFIRNDKLDASAWGTTAGSKKPELRLNYYGVSVGGPVRIPGIYNGKDKTFFFVDWEQEKRRAGIASNPVSVPTAYEQETLRNDGILDITDLTSIDNYATVSKANSVLTAEHIDPIMKNYFLLFPAPNRSCSATTAFGCLNYVSTPVEALDVTNLDVRIDHRLNDKNQLFARFEYNPTSVLEPEEFPQITEATIAQGIYSSAAKPFIGIYPGGNGRVFSGPSFTNTYGIQADYVHLFSDKLLMDLKMAYTRINIQSKPFNYGTDAATQVGWSSSLDTGNILPTIGGPYSSWTSVLGSSNSEPIIDVNNSFQYAGSVSYTKNTHDFKFGASIIRRQVNAWTNSMAGGYFLTAGSDNSSAPSAASQLPYTDDRLNFLNGTPYGELRQDNYYKSGFRTWEPSVYVLDNWRFNSKLTLNLGVRYDIYSPFTEAHGHYANFQPSCLSTSSLITDGSSCFIDGSKSSTIGVKTDYSNIQPRVGFAYSIDTKTVLRGAFGMTYFTPDQGQISIGLASPQSVMQNYNPQSAFNYSVMGFPFATDSQAVCGNYDGSGNRTTGCVSNGPVQPSIPTSADISAFASNSQITSVSYKDKNFKNGYAEMGNLAIQRQVGGSTITLAWVGTFGRHLLRASNLTLAAAPGSEWAAANGGSSASKAYTYATQAPYLGTIAHLYNGSMSSYNAGQLIYSHRAWHGLDINANLNWGHTLTNQGSSGDGYSYIPSESSSVEYGGRPQERYAGTLGYEVPFGKNLKGITGIVAKGWKLNAIGYYQSGSTTTVTAASHLAVNGVQAARPNMTGSPDLSHPTTSQWFKTSAFSTPTEYGVYGSERPAQVLTPPARNLDFSINKNFPVFEKLTGEFRAECFNIMNIPNYDVPGTNMGQSATFGMITSVANEARELQFAVKLKF